jgi:modulator of FtsH protease
VPQDWTNFALVTGGASGALTGLLFVAVSLNRDRIAGHPALRSQAGQTLVLFMLPLLLSVLLVLPGTSAAALGTALVALAVVVGAVLLLVGRVQKPTGSGAEERLALLLDKVSPNLIVVLLIVVAGCLQLVGDDGLYWVAASSVLSLVGGVVNAWLFLTRS